MSSLALLLKVKVAYQGSRVGYIYNVLGPYCVSNGSFELGKILFPNSPERCCNLLCSLHLHAHNICYPLP